MMNSDWESSSYLFIYNLKEDNTGENNFKDKLLISVPNLSQILAIQKSPKKSQIFQVNIRQWLFNQTVYNIHMSR